MIFSKFSKKINCQYYKLYNCKSYNLNNNNYVLYKNIDDIDYSIIDKNNPYAIGITNIINNMNFIPIDFDNIHINNIHIIPDLIEKIKSKAHLKKKIIHEYVYISSYTFNYVSIHVHLILNDNYCIINDLKKLLNTNLSELICDSYYKMALDNKTITIRVTPKYINNKYIINTKIIKLTDGILKNLQFLKSITNSRFIYKKSVVAENESKNFIKINLR